jgi:hypothetical protein
LTKGGNGRRTGKTKFKLIKSQVFSGIKPTSNNRIFIFVSKILNSFDSKLDNGIEDGIPVLFQVPRSIVLL